MRNIEITDNRNEMEKIGRDIFEEKKKIYDDKTVDFIYSVINRVCPTLTEGEKQQAFFCSVYDYWVYGCSIKEEFYYDFIHKTDERKREFLTFRSRFMYYDFLNNKKGSKICSNKWESYNLFKKYYGRDIILLEDSDEGASYETFVNFVNSHPDFVIKPVDLGQGQGVEKISINDFDGNLEKLYKALITIREKIYAKYTWGESKGLLLEELIKTCDEMKVLHPQSINGIRCTTLRTDNEVVIYHPWMMCGSNGDFAVCGDLNYKCANVDVATGIVDTLLHGEYCDKYEFHPDTKVKIPGFAIPKWDELKKITLELSDILPDVRYIGWDMVLNDKRQWVVMEANECGEPLWQLVTGKGCRPELESLIGWRPTKTFWWE